MIENEDDAPDFDNYEERPLLFRDESSFLDEENGSAYSPSPYGSAKADTADADAIPPPPPPPPSSTSSTRRAYHVSSLDFERIVNQYSVQAVRDQWLLPPLPEDGSTSASAVAYARKRYGNTGNTADDEEDDDEEETSDRPTSAKKTKNKQRLRYTSKPHLLGYTGRTATRWVLSVVAGLMTGLTTILIVSITGNLIVWRSHHLQSLIANPEYSDDVVFAVFLSLNLALSLSSCWLCVMWVPQAAGSGISQVKAYLNGIRGNQKFTRLTLFFVKIVGTILSVSSSLAIGMEGPLIHIGAIMGSSCSKISGFSSHMLQKFQQCNDCFSCCCDLDSIPGFPQRNPQYIGPSLTQRILSWTTTELSHFATDAERRDLVSIGASCGFAASFGAPIGGLLFILDDIASYFTKGLLLRILVANAVGIFCLAVQHGDLSNYSVINLGTYTGADPTSNIFVNRVEEVPLYILCGILFGILGGVFCSAFMFLRRNITDKMPPPGRSRALLQLLEVAVLSILTSVVIFYLPTQTWSCKPRPTTGIFATDAQHDFTEQYASEHRLRFFCQEGEINELANMLFGSRIDAIKRILADPTQFKRETLVTVGFTFYFLMALTFGVELPSGIFTPSVLIGASLGGALGMTFQDYIDWKVEASTFALLGVAGLLAGIQRSTVSLVVILVEGTGQIKVLTPAIIVVVVSRYVASLIHKKGIFEAVMEWKKLPYLEHESKRWYDAVEVCEVMSEPPLQAVHPNEAAKDLVELLATSTHHGFPVVDPKTNKFLGLVRRDQIVALLECGVFERNPDISAMTPVWSRPRAGVEKTALMRWAYHINDDRYDYVLQDTHHQLAHKVPEVPRKIAPRFSVRNAPSIRTTTFAPLPHEFATVHSNDAGLIYVSWLNREYENYYVNLGAVMNRGTHCVTEFCPVSKAHRMFTHLGLRHIVVLGGDSGGEVVGLITRENLLPEFIKARTGF